MAALYLIYIFKFCSKNWLENINFRFTWYIKRMYVLLSNALHDYFYWFMAYMSHLICNNAFIYFYLLYINNLKNNGILGIYMFTTVPSSFLLKIFKMLPVKMLIFFAMCLQSLFHLCQWFHFYDWFVIENWFLHFRFLIISTGSLPSSKWFINRWKG